MKIKILGSYGSKGRGKGMVSLQISEKVVVDAGNLLDPLGEEARKIEHIFLTHHHLDHICDIPFLIDDSYPTRERELKIYGLDSTLMAIRKYIMNSDLWPDFSEIKLITNGKESIIYQRVEIYKEIIVDTFSFYAFPSNHIVPCVGYVVKNLEEKKGLLISGDTYINPKIWEILNNDNEIKTALIDVSFSSKLHNLGRLSKHLTTDVFKDEIKNLKRKIPIYIYHIKPGSYEEIKKEIEGLENVFITYDGQEIEI